MKAPKLIIPVKYSNVLLGLFVVVWTALLIYTMTNPFSGSMNGGRLFIFILEKRGQKGQVISVFTTKRATRNIIAERYTQVPTEIILDESLWSELLSLREEWCKEPSAFSSEEETLTEYYKVQVGCKLAFQPVLYFPISQAPPEIIQLFQTVPTIEDQP